MGLLSGFKKVISKAGGAIGTIAGGFFGGPAGAALGGTIGGSLQSGFGEADRNSAQQAAAQNQMNFQERMSNTSWQRGVADMRKAGINPIFAYKVGGASSPVGAMPIYNNEGAAAVEGASKMASSASAIKSLSPKIQNLNAQTRLTKAQATTQGNIGSHLVSQASHVDAQAETEKARKKVVEEQARIAKEQANLLEMQRQTTAAGLHGAITGAEWKSSNEAMARIEQFMKMIGFNSSSAMPNVNVNLK